MARLRKKEVKAPRAVKSSAKVTTHEFKKPADCWQQSTQHKHHFVGTLQCDKSYHDDKHACLALDRWISKVAGAKYKTTFFSYYDVVHPGRTPLHTYVYTKGLVTDRPTLERLRLYSVKKVEFSTVRHQEQEFKRLFFSWPPTFTLDPNLTLQQKRSLKKAVEACVERRVWYRQKCVLECSTKLDTRSHDKFILILQILRAELVVGYNVESGYPV